MTGVGSSQHMETSNAPVLHFSDLPLAPTILHQLDRLKFVKPTPIQGQSIPLAIEGKDLIGIAQTGTGKTLAFGLPLIQRLMQTDGLGTALILLPTRELAFQVQESLQPFAIALGMRTALLIGGAAISGQIQSLRQKPRILIATPGRLIDHMDQRTVDLRHLKFLVLDEADRMLDMGFAPQIQKILQNIPKERQTMLFSATMPADIVRLANSYMKAPTRVEIARAGTTSDRVTQELFFVRKEDKTRLVDKLLGDYSGTVLIFTRTKFGAKRLCRSIRDMGHSAAEIHANRSLSQRREALEGFKRGKYRVLVATDIAARGIDVTGIQLVINFDLPDGTDDYVHRIGRTGRADHRGHAISFATPDQKREVRDIERLIRAILPVTPLPELPAHRPTSVLSRDEERRFEGQRSFGGGGRSGGGRSSSRFGGASRPSGGSSYAPREGGRPAYNRSAGRSFDRAPRAEEGMGSEYNVPMNTSSAEGDFSSGAPRRPFGSRPRSGGSGFGGGSRGPRRPAGGAGKRFGGGQSRSNNWSR